MLDPRPNSPTVSDVSQGPWALVLSHRTIDRSGALVDVLFSERRDMAAAEAFFRSAKAVTGMTPDRVMTRRPRQRPPGDPHRAGPGCTAPDQRLPE
jgi:hypothetical protein